jgi:hypothetical protein
MQGIGLKIMGGIEGSKVSESLAGMGGIQKSIMSESSAGTGFTQNSVVSESPAGLSNSQASKVSESPIVMGGIQGSVILESPAGTSTDNFSSGHSLHTQPASVPGKNALVHDNQSGSGVGEYQSSDIVTTNQGNHSGQLPSLSSCLPAVATTMTIVDKSSTGAKGAAQIHQQNGLLLACFRKCTQQKYSPRIHLFLSFLRMYLRKIDPTANFEW